MSPLIDGFSALLDPTVLLCLAAGAVVGMLVGAFPGVTATMAVALASGFTLALDPLPGLAVLLTIYVAANFGDRVPAILIKTPGTPASIATTFDGYPMAQQGKAGLALTSSAFASAWGTVVGVVLLMVAAIPLARLALNFGPAEMFALVVFGLTMMIGVSGGQLLKGLMAGSLGLLLSAVGRDPITGDARFTFGITELSDGIPFIAAIIGLFGVAEVMNQIITHRKRRSTDAITTFGRWMPTRRDWREMLKPLAIGSGVGGVVGVVPATGGDIAGILGWDQARRLSKKSGEFGKGSLEGLTAADTSSNATLGGSVTTTLALGLPGDSVMAVMIGSMVVWGIQPGPSLFANQPDLVYSIAGIMLIATALALAVSLLRMRGVAKILELPQHYLWAVILVFCMVGTFAVNNSVFDVGVMLAFGLVGLFLKRFSIPPGPIVLGLILGELAESNLRRALEIGGVENIATSPIAVGFLLVSVLALVGPVIRRTLKARRETTASAPVE